MVNWVSIGRISGTFGKTGKFKATFPNGFSSENPEKEKLIFRLKRYIFEKDKKSLHQWKTMNGLLSLLCEVLCDYLHVPISTLRVLPFPVSTNFVIALYCISEQLHLWRRINHFFFELSSVQKTEKIPWMMSLPQIPWARGISMVFFLCSSFVLDPSKVIIRFNLHIKRIL